MSTITVKDIKMKCPKCKSKWFWLISGLFSNPMILKCGDCKYEWKRNL